MAVESVHIKGVSDGFRELGYEVEFSSPPMVRVSTDKTVSQNNLYNLIVRNLPTICYEFLALIHNAVSLGQCKQLLAKKNFTIIYERYAFFEFSTVFLKKKFNSFLVLEVNGAVNRKDPVHGRKIVMKALAGLLEKKMFAAADLIVVVSSALKHSLVEEIGVPSEKIIVTHNAVDLKKFDQTRTGEKIRKTLQLGQKKVIGFVGSFTFWHGLGFLINSTADLLRNDKNVHLLLVGDGREREAISKMIEQENLTESVTITGRVPHENIPSYIAAMDIGVMPDSNNFGSPMKIFEYMAMGKPVISANYAPIAEVIQEGRTGYLFSPRNEIQFAKKIHLLIYNEKLRNEMGSNACNYVKGTHTWRKNIEKIISRLPAGI